MFQRRSSCYCQSNASGGRYISLFIITLVINEDITSTDTEELAEIDIEEKWPRLHVKGVGSKLSISPELASVGLVYNHKYNVVICLNSNCSSVLTSMTHLTKTHEMKLNQKQLRDIYKMIKDLKCNNKSDPTVDTVDVPIEGFLSFCGFKCCSCGYLAGTKNSVYEHCRSEHNLKRNDAM